MDGSMSGRHEARRCRHEQRNAYASLPERDADADAGTEGPIASELAQDAHAGRGASLACRPARCGKTRTSAMITTLSTSDASGRLTSSPPLPIGLSRKSPRVAPSGRVRMNAAQKRTTWEMFAQK